MTEENKAKIVQAQAEAWRKVSSLWSQVELAGSDSAKASWIAVIGKEIARRKKEISNLIDRIPD